MARSERVDEKIAAAAPFARPIMEHLRALVHEAAPEVEEAIKWGMPSFVHRGRIVATMAAFSSHVSFGFWQRDAIGRTGKEGEAMGQFGRIASLADLPTGEEIRGKVREAVALIDAGARLPGRSRRA